MDLIGLILGIILVVAFLGMTNRVDQIAKSVKQIEEAVVDSKKGKEK